MKTEYDHIKIRPTKDGSGYEITDGATSPSVGQIWSMGTDIFWKSEHLWTVPEFLDIADFLKQLNEEI